MIRWKPNSRETKILYLYNVRNTRTGAYISNRARDDNFARFRRIGVEKYLLVCPVVVTRKLTVRDKYFNKGDV